MDGKAENRDHGEEAEQPPVCNVGEDQIEDDKSTDEQPE